MKKLILITIALLTTLVSYSQSIIKQTDWLKNPKRYSNKTVTIIDVEIINTPHERTRDLCIVPKGNERVNVYFKSDPKYTACFFTNRMMSNAIKRLNTNGHLNAMITIRGDERTGYNIIKVRPMKKSEKSFK